MYVIYEQQKYQNIKCQMIKGLNVEYKRSTFQLEKRIEEREENSREEKTRKQTRRERRVENRREEKEEKQIA